MVDVPEVNQVDTICYVLMADSEFGSFLEEDSIFRAVRSDIRKNIIFESDLSLSHLSIEFKEIGNVIVVG